jgi:DNA repair protein RadC
MKKQSVQDLPKLERPREKLSKYGPGRLSNIELLAILLRTGRKGKSVIEISKEVEKKFGEKMLSLEIEDLLTINGIGLAKATELLAAIEITKRYLNLNRSKIIQTAEDVWHELEDIRASKKEHFVVFYLDTRNQLISRETVSIGTVSASIVHPREVFEPAIKHVASKIILAHNHPSGVTEPSLADIKVTERLKKAAKILDIEIVDHVIVSKDSWSSAV